ncbi:enoyl-CoA hydratase/isomerase family protein [Virgibacillus halodenitrificans]|uniref:enoyl-CoA hydratase/isomerase family protein n=1 Tax=Virgibacillus halodenitrificans TaxID=1482 RepID=UPI00045CF762|nr:enoyl-CoA hydratase/isomerase family protein [Virgibacillus halodenitrificans]MCJ0931308.1 enoyl-CoA hydratase/isomerase family protein [Virgibacillus halodenitrificans]MEC2160197.1 enoyl-CoA hydratase/isomerase family protein [Virgibacillus halodenitrificans]MYL46548.1 enoyl-CoA hydratase/isomerase family protein [Virgibacillus halodenitrificans]MYL56868.1 enoyl-CoA hydratase/isomerase family protein [Virgibacillus halodenitrificans]WHX27065.1 enoyl-CoA hydratase/isomerase family protein [
MEKHITYTSHQKNYGEIYLNRPEKHNAISKQMTEEFMRCILEAKKDTIKFLVITGAGEKMFCSGGDLTSLHGNLSSDEAFNHLYPMKEVLAEIMTFPVPVICLLNGGALGGGCEIATACDLRIAKEGSKFGFVQSKLGIVPGWGGGTLLYEKVEPSFAFQWLLEGTVLEAPYLKERGWIQHIVADEEWKNTEKLLEPYISKSYEQMKVLKKQFKKKLSSIGLSSVMAEEVRNCAILWESEEHIQAVNKFLTR